MEQRSRRIETEGNPVIDQSGHDQLRPREIFVFISRLNRGKSAQPVGNGPGQTLGHGLLVIQTGLVAGDPENHRAPGLENLFPGKLAGLAAKLGERGRAEKSRNGPVSGRRSANGDSPGRDPSGPPKRKPRRSPHRPGSPAGMNQGLEERDPEPPVLAW